MATGFYNVPKAVNEPVKAYAPDSPEREELLATYKKMYNKVVDIPFYIGGLAVKSGKTVSMQLKQEKNGLLLLGKTGLQYF